MPAPRPFDILRAAFWLLAVLVGTALASILITSVGCTVALLIGRIEPGTCVKLGLPEFYHDVWSEALTAILALLAARPGPPRGPDQGGPSPGGGGTNPDHPQEGQEGPDAGRPQ